MPHDDLHEDKAKAKGLVKQDLDKRGHFDDDKHAHADEAPGDDADHGAAAYTHKWKQVGDTWTED